MQHHISPAAVKWVKGCSLTFTCLHPAQTPIHSIYVSAVALDYKLYKGEAGWDIPGFGDLEKVKPPSGLTLREEIVQCARYCDRKRGCTIFTFYQNTCYLKRAVSKSPSYKGRTTKGWRWLYIEEG